jgi:hypothetical protein
MGVTLQAPGTKRMNRLLSERGPENPETITARRRLDALPGC